MMMMLRARMGMGWGGEVDGLKMMEEDTGKRFLIPLLPFALANLTFFKTLSPLCRSHHHHYHYRDHRRYHHRHRRHHRRLL